MVDNLMIDQKFDEVLLKAVDFSFEALGKSCQLALYFHLKTIFHIERADIPNKVEQFDDALNSIFRDGAVFLEKLVLEKLCEELGVKFEERYVFDFVEAVSKIRGLVLEKEPFLTLSGLEEKATIAEGKSGGKTLEES